ncbi:MAG: cytidyltransferase [Bacteroidetes bacterium RIFCSPLOWO2_12_FULL_35_15]|nr:MAG: cytidyltransferase [Bacteroidetes bacterium RIFCSPLOWO2_12_FULL_35_15]
MKKILITICARGGSKGIPGKNIKMMNGKLLISYTIETALKFSNLHNVQLALSTDSIDIKNTAEKFGLKTDYIRPADLATDSAGKLPVIKDVLHYHEKLNNTIYDFVIDLDITSPLRTIDDLQSALTLLIDSKEAVNLFSVSKAHRNPYFNMVEEQPDGFYYLVKSGNFLTRQSSPKVYDLNASFYIFKRHFFEMYNSAMTPKSIIYEVPHVCFDLDEPLDFEFLEFLLKNKKLNFEL